MLVIDLDGVLGYFDEHKTYAIRQNILNLLFSLSMSFRIVGFTIGIRKHYVRKLISQLANASKPFVFDAVYAIKQNRQNEKRANLTQLLLDFHDEAFSFGAYCATRVIVLHPERQDSQTKIVNKSDVRNCFCLEKEHADNLSKAPLIIKVPHARLRPAPLLFESLYQLLFGLLVCSNLEKHESESRFSFNEDTKTLMVPFEKSIDMENVLPNKMKFMDKYMASTNSVRFQKGKPHHEFGFSLSRGFKQLTQIASELDWIDYQVFSFKSSVPLC